MVTAKIETEHKYEADTGTVLPDLTGLPGVAAQSDADEYRLIADYFDTDDLRLLRAGITLRRRTGGTDAGWHLKLPAAPGSRTELARPLGRGSAVPAELSRLVRAQSRGAPLRRVATIDTVRRQRLLLDAAGSSLAELADDEVTAQRHGQHAAELTWREIEVELTGGDEGLLRAADDRLQAAGLRIATNFAKLERVLGDQLPPRVAVAPLTAASTSGDVVLAYLSAQIRALQAADPLIRREVPDSVHQMRVATRRLRATLKAYAAVLDPAATEQLAAELKWLGQVLGAARDGEVLIEHLQSLLAPLPADLVLGPVEAELTEQLAPRSAAARRGAIRALDSRRYLALLDGLDDLLAQPPLTPAAGRPARALRVPVRHAYRRLRKRIRRALNEPEGAAQDAALHEARKAAKRARYAADVLVPVTGQHAGRFAKRMKKLQSVLGDQHDSVIARAAIRDLGVRAHLAGQNAFTYGLLHERDASAARTLTHQARHAWRQTERRKYRRWLRGA